MSKKSDDELRKNGLRPVHLIKAKHIPAAVALATPEQLARNCSEDTLHMALDIQKLQKAFWRKSPTKNILTTDDPEVIALHESGRMNAIINERIISSDPAAIPAKPGDEGIIVDCNNGHYNISSAVVLRWMANNGVKFVGDEEFFDEAKIAR